jgi:hypothetical protein
MRLHWLCSAAVAICAIGCDKSSSNKAPAASTTPTANTDGRQSPPHAAPIDAQAADDEPDEKPDDPPASQYACQDKPPVHDVVRAARRQVR